MSNDKMRAEFGERIRRHIRNLEETSYNEGSHALACRCSDSLEFIRELQAAFAAQAQEAPSEPEVVMYQCRMLPEFSGDDCLEWETCSQGTYNDIQKLGEQPGSEWIYETRALSVVSLARPAPASAQAAVPPALTDGETHLLHEAASELEFGSMDAQRIAYELRAMLAALPSTQQGGGE